MMMMLSRLALVGVRRWRSFATRGALDALFERLDAGEIEMTGSQGLLPALLKEELERGLAAELSEHLGYEKGQTSTRAALEHEERHDEEDRDVGGGRGNVQHRSGPRCLHPHSTMKSP